MTKAQEHLLMLFNEIADICHRHNIVYYMAGGTLIGAIRHKGFIPWDDDMDILMTRDNWHKFIEVTRTDMPENRVLECQELDRDYPNMFGRYTDTTSSAIHKNQVLGDGIAGYVVDILVLDPIPDKEETYIKYRDDLMLYSDLVNPSLNYSYRWGINKKRFNKYYSRVQKEGKDKVLRELEQQMFCYEEKDCDYYVMRWGGAPFLFDKDMYGESRWADFEGTRCRVPDRTGDYLTWHYGDDWMYIPPHGEHESHEAIFSFTTDYKTIQNDYMRYLDVDGIRNAVIKRKKFFLKQMKRRLKSKDSIVQISADAACLDLKTKVANFDGDLEQMLEEARYDELSQFFGKYYNEQGSRQIIGREDYLGIYRFHNPYLVEVDDSIIYVAVMTLIHTNKIAKAARFLDVREQKKGPLSEKLLFARNLIAEIREAITDYDLGRKDEAFQKAEALYARYPKSKSLVLFRTRLLIEYKKYEEAKAELDKALELFPNDGYFHKYLGDYYYEHLEDKDKAYQCYEYASAMTNNGIVLLEMEERALSDKAEWLDKAAAEGNTDICEMMLKLIPADMDAIVAKYLILIDKCESSKDAAELMKTIEDEFHNYEMNEAFARIFEAFYGRFGEEDQLLKLRVGLKFATVISEYNDLKDRLESALEKEPNNGSYMKLLGDVYNWFGKKAVAKEKYDKAATMDCSQYVKFELEEGK